MSLMDPNPVNTKKPKRIAMVVSNPATSTTTGWPVGFWWSELAHPFFLLSEKGYEVEIFSEHGGKCEADAMSDPRDPSGYSSSDLISMVSSPRQDSRAWSKHRESRGNRRRQIRRHHRCRRPGTDVYFPGRHGSATEVRRVLRKG
jgi:hypothetical protein